MIKALLDKIFGRSPSPECVQEIERPTVSASPEPSLSAAPSHSPEQQREWLRDQIRRDIAGGFMTRDAILQTAEDCFEEEFPDGEARRLAEAMLPGLLDQHRAEQADWPEQTDCDRLDAAFVALEQSGIISRQNFSCCGTCGSAEIWDEIDAVKQAGGPTRGYAFYHMQDTESAADGSGLYLNYGACEEGETPALEVASDIVAELERHGLATRWDGSWGQRIGVTLDWKRRSALAA